MTYRREGVVEWACRRCGTQRTLCTEVLLRTDDQMVTTIFVSCVCCGDMSARRGLPTETVQAMLLHGADWQKQPEDTKWQTISATERVFCQSSSTTKVIHNQAGCNPNKRKA